MEAKQFKTKEELIEHLKASKGDKFTLVAVLASQQKALGRALMGELVPALAATPEKLMLVTKAMARNTSCVLRTVIEMGGLEQQVDEVLAAADAIFDLANDEAHALVAAQKAPTHETPATPQ